METSREVTLNVEVERVSYITMSNGKILPAIIFKDSEELKKEDIDSIMFDSFEYFLINRPTNVLNTIVLKSKNGQNFLELESCKSDINSEKIQYAEDIYCSSCGSKAVTLDDEFYCNNHSCPANSRAPLRLLIERASIVRNMALINRFLSEFCIDNEKVSIANSYEFLKLFFLVKHKNTTAREENWKKLHNSSFSSIFWLIEKDIESYLRSEKIQSKDFWSVLNLPVKPHELDLLQRINPKDFMLGTFNKNLLSDSVLHVLNGSYELVSIWYNIFNFYGEKEWI